MNKLLGLLCLVSLVWLCDALSRQEIYDLIHDVSDEFRQESISKLKSKMKEAKLMAVSPLRRACIYGNAPEAYKEINTSIASKLYEIMSEWKNKTSAELEAVTVEDVRKIVEEKVKPEMDKSLSQRIELIMNC